MIKNLIILSAVIIAASCNQPQQKETTAPVTAKPKERKPAPDITYTFVKAKDWWKENRGDASKVRIVLAANRMDSSAFKKKDSVIVPNNFSGDVEYYLPFPFHVQALNGVKKILLFSYPAQAFAAYENGELVYTGPTNMGRRKDPTPTGLYFTNWKAEKTTSTFNDEWELKWNFNIENKLGVGFHQYELPGYPASHSCLRLLEADAKYLYEWADQWVLKGTDNILAKGTPVIVFGSYDFDAPAPWWQQVSNPKALQITEQQVSEIVAPHQPAIKAAQDQRDALGATAKPQ